MEKLSQLPAHLSGSTGDERRTDPDDMPLDYVLGEVSAALQGLKFGVVSIIVQDGVVVQIERTDKRRIRRVDKKS